MTRYGGVDLRYVGMVRTVSFLKAIGLFDVERIEAINLTREVQRERTREKVKDVVFRDRCLQESYEVAWDAHENAGSFPVFPKEKVVSLIHKAALGDFVIQALRYRFVAPKLATYLNDEIRSRALAKGKDLRDVTFLPETTAFYADYARNYSEDLKALPYLADLNRHEIEAFRFKLSTLDLQALVTERSIKYGEKERIPLSEDAMLIRYVLQALEWDGWPVAHRTISIGGSRVVVKPAALREYRAGSNKGWVLTGQTEVE